MTNKAFADGKGPSYTYTAAGRLQTRVWARGVTTTDTYDNAGGLWSVWYSDATVGFTNGYDRLGRLVTETNGATVCQWTYNGANELLSETFSGGPLDGLAVTNGYDSLLRRTQLSTLSASSQLQSAAYGYDAASRLSTVSDGINNAAYTYLANSPLVSQITFQSNSVVRMTTTKQYDFLNRLTSISSAPSASSAVNFNYGNNTANQRTAVTNADGSYWIYQYDSLGQVTSGKKYWAGGTPVAGQQFTYNFDNIGNRLNTGTGGDASGNNLRNANYTNNILNQITGCDVPGYVEVLGSANPNATVTVNLQRAYRYGSYFSDELGVNNSGAPLYLSLTNLAVLNNGTNADIISTNIGNVLLSQTPQAFQYDADGNLTNDGVFSYSWDAENRVTNITSLSSMPTNAAVQEVWSYLPNGRWSQLIVSKWNGATYVAQSTNRFLWDEKLLLAEVAPNGTLIRSYMRGSDLSGTMQGAGGVGGLLEVSYYGTQTTNCFLAFDGNGNVAALVSAADGSTAANYEYGPFGEVIRSTGPIAKANPIRFSTQWADDTVNGDLKYLYRTYRTSTGTWKSRDPMGEKGGRNLYCFVRNIPIQAFDKMGLSFMGWLCCKDECPYIGAVQNVKLYEYRITVAGRNPDEGSLTAGADTDVENVANLGPLGDAIEAGIQGGWKAGTLAGIASEFNVSDDLVNSLYKAMLQYAMGQFEGFNVYTKVEYDECRSYQCHAFYTRRDWHTSTISEWKEGTANSVYPNSAPGDYFFGWYGSLQAALSNVSACAQAHIDEVIAQGAKNDPSNSNL